MIKSDKFIISASLFGVLVSLYTLYVEFRKELDKNYVAFCDISEYVACSKVFTSKYGKGFGLIALLFGEDSPINQPNPVFGILYYVLMILLSLSPRRTALNVQFLLTSVSLAGCCWLGYVLFFKLHDFCIVCTTMYALQTSLLVALFFKLKTFNYRSKPKTKKN